MEESDKVLPLVQVLDGLMAGAKDLDPMAAIPESHPVTQSASYALTADCSTSLPVQPGSTGPNIGDLRNSRGPNIATLAAPSMRIRVTGRPSSAICRATNADDCDQHGRVAQSAYSQQGSEGLMSLNADSGAQQVHVCRLQASTSSTTGASSSQHGMQRMDHTPVHGVSHAFAHGNALTGATLQGAGSPLPQRALSERAPVDHPVPQNGMESEAGGEAQTDEEEEVCRVIDRARLLSAGQQKGAKETMGKAEGEAEGKREGQGERQSAGKREGERLGVVGMALVDGEWCEAPASPRWWDNVAKTDVIGIKELQRLVLLADRGSSLCVPAVPNLCLICTSSVPNLCLICA